MRFPLLQSRHFLAVLGLVLILVTASVLAPQVAAKGGALKSPPGQPLINDLTTLWRVYGAAEMQCPDRFRVSGFAVTFTGVLSHFGLSTFTESRAIDWTVPPTGPFEPTIAFDFSGTPIVGPYTFSTTTGDPSDPDCVTDGGRTATGELLIETARGDTIVADLVDGAHYQNTGDEENPSWILERFGLFVIRGGTGRFASASGSFVIHTIQSEEEGFLLSEILSASISY